MIYQKMLSDGENVIKTFSWNYKQYEFSKSVNELYITNKSIIYIQENFGDHHKIAIKDVKLISTSDYSKSDNACYIVYVNPRAHANQGFEFSIGKDDDCLFEDISEALFKLIG